MSDVYDCLVFQNPQNDFLLQRTISTIGLRVRFLRLVRNSVSSGRSKSCRSEPEKNQFSSVYKFSTKVFDFQLKFRFKLNKILNKIQKNWLNSVISVRILVSSFEFLVKISIFDFF